MEQFGLSNYSGIGLGSVVFGQADINVTQCQKKVRMQRLEWMVGLLPVLRRVKQK